MQSIKTSVKSSVKALFLAGAIALSMSAPASAADRTITLVNKTSSIIVSFFASNAGTTDWEEDILGQDMLGPGQSVEIDLNDGSGYCKFDFKAQFDDDTESVQENVNVCEISEFSFTN